MRSKAPLALMEQMVMLLVFALAAALCVQVFVLSDKTSRRNEARDQAVLAAQNAAETLKNLNGDYQTAAEYSGGSWDGQVWEQELDCGVLKVTAADSDTPLLGMAEAAVYDEDGKLLFTLPIAWQEVDGDD
jgi:type II secretory pathway pseudopilin PulG